MENRGSPFLNSCLKGTLGTLGGDGDQIERLWGPVSPPKEEVAAAERH